MICWLTDRLLKTLKKGSEHMVFQPIDQLRFQADTRPDAIAIQGLDRGLTFRVVYQRVRQIAHKLREAGVAPGDVVMTSLAGRATDWLVSLALLHEAAIGASGVSAELPDPALQVSWFIADSAIPAWPAEQLIVLDKEWLTNLPSGDILPHRYTDADSVCRLIMTSGTTGHAKAVPFSVDLLRVRLGCLIGYWSTTQNELNLMSVSTIGGFMSAFYALASGTPLFQIRGISELIPLIQRFGIVNLSASPTQLAEFVQQAELLGEPLPSLKLVRTGGGMISKTLLDGLARCTRADVMNVYGSTEAGGIANANASLVRLAPTLAGFILPGIECQIVNEQDEVLPPGMVGIIRLRALAMAPGYFRNDTATTACFRDGWFYSGDTGMLNEQGQLHLAGRSSELINCGGVKLDPVAIDTFIQVQPDVVDAAVFSFQDARGIETVAAAMVVPAGFDFAALQRDIATHFGRYAVPVSIMSMKRIPRNEMGKIQRALLARMLEENQNSSSPASLQ